MKNESTTNPVRTELQALVNDLATLKDDLKVQAKLGTMELRQRWDALQKRYDTLHDAIRNARDEALHGLGTAVAELRKDVSRLRKDAGLEN